MHRKGGAVASCDLDADHAAAPDLPAGTVHCEVCHGPLRVSAHGRLEHVTPAPDAHPVAPRTTSAG